MGAQRDGFITLQNKVSSEAFEREMELKSHVKNLENSNDALQHELNEIHSKKSSFLVELQSTLKTKKELRMAHSSNSKLIEEISKFQNKFIKLNDQEKQSKLRLLEARQKIEILERTLELQKLVNVEQRSEIKKISTMKTKNEQVDVNSSKIPLRRSKRLQSNQYM